MESIDSVYTSSQEEQSPEEQPVVQLATIAGIVDDGLTLLLDGSEEPSEKRYKCNAAIDFAAGQRVAVLELSGSKVVMFPVGLPGTLAPHGVPPGGTKGQFLKKSVNDDYKLTWGSINGTLPGGGTDGQVLLKSGATDYDVKWGDIKGMLPPGGTQGQVLKKSSGTDYACSWGTIDGTLPSGGTDGQVLLKSGATNYAVKWGDIKGLLPTGGALGQVLKKSSGTDYACSWGSVDGTLPRGGTDGQVLLKSGATNYSAKWGAVPAPAVAALTSGAYKLTLSSRTLTPSATGFEIGTSSYPVGLHSGSVRLYYSAYRYCTLTCTSAGKLAVDGTAIN